MDSQQALDNWWKSFQWEAWEENSVPDNALKDYGHYITYTAGTSEFERPMMLSASLWERSTSWAGTVNKASEIEAAIGLGGTVIPFDGGAIWMKRGSPFSQRMNGNDYVSEGKDDSVRRIYINVEVEYFTTV